jgi:hypothetical protein
VGGIQKMTDTDQSLDPEYQGSAIQIHISRGKVVFYSPQNGLLRFMKNLGGGLLSGTF